MAAADAPGPQRPDPLIALRRALSRLEAIALDPEGEAALADAMQALADLEQPAVVDRVVFDSLLSMAGPLVARDLVVQMTTDLRAIAMALPPAMASHDWSGIRAQAHVLVALAGAAGAQTLESAAQALNRAAHDHDAQTAEHWYGLVQLWLAALIRFLEDMTPHLHSAHTGHR